MWGDGVNEDETLPAQLERLLVMKPDAVLLLYSENDLQDMLADPSLRERLVQARQARSGLRGVVYSIFRGTAVVELALRAREAWRSRQLVDRIEAEVANRHWNDELLSVYSKEVSEMRDQLDEMEIDLIVMA